MKVSRVKIRFGSPDRQLAGELLLPQAREPAPGAVLCHGLASGKESMRPVAWDLARLGVATLIFDLRGHGESSGVYDGAGSEDVLAAVEHLGTVPGVDGQRIAVAGHSSGAREALLAAAQNREITALVCTSCPGDGDGGIPGPGEHLLRRVHRPGKRVFSYPQDGPLPWLDGLPAWASWAWMRARGYRLRVDWQAALSAWAQARPGLAILEMEPRPLLIVHCQGDRTVPYLSSVILYRKAHEPKELMTPQGGWHATPLLPGRLRAAWTGWLVRTLQGAPSHAG
jgi:pimeloyl-ACP methyl ester carboxylesterase